MAEYSIKELEQKFMNAHNAGDTKAARYDCQPKTWKSS